MNWNNGIIRPSADFAAQYLTNPGIPLGGIAYDGLNNKYRFVKFVEATLYPGKIVRQALTANVGAVDITNITGYSTEALPNGPERTYITDNGNLVLSANQLAGALAFVTGGTGVSALGFVKDHPAYATAAPSAAATAINLVGPIANPVALAVPDSTSEVSLVLPWNVELTTAATFTECALGVSMRAMTINYFGWILVNGYGLLCSTAALTAGYAAAAGGATVDGHALDHAATANYNIIGRVIRTVADAITTNTYICLAYIQAEAA